MKQMNYQTASMKALKCFETVRKSMRCDLIEKDAQFRQLTVLESTGRSDDLCSVLFEIEFCGKDGDNYRIVWVRVHFDEEVGITSCLEESSIKEVK